MITGDGAYIKQINRGLILRKIIEEKLISRADLSKITGLNKATVSVQVADLLQDHLIYETQQEHNVVGRRPIMLSINRPAGFVLGIDLDYKQVQFIVSDLGGQPVQQKTIKLDSENYHEFVTLLIHEISAYEQQYKTSEYGLISTVIGIHGTVTKDEKIHFVPSFQWKNKNLKEDLQKELAIDISIHNNANLSAYAERVYEYHKSDNLLCVMLASGIGVGLMIDGQLQTGFHGFAGEMGHMIIQQDGDLCNCGNRGCWELYSSEKSLFTNIVKRLQLESLTYEELKYLIDSNNPDVIELIEQYMLDLSTGLNNIINLYNPETLVLTNDVLKMYPNAVEKIKANFQSTISHYGVIALSNLGNKSCAMGACALAIQRFLEVPEIKLSLEENFSSKKSQDNNNVHSSCLA